jgi:NAD(P)-dependent dehydrogenase (short-subunit alcohol dehydrogenase family)
MAQRFLITGVSTGLGRAFAVAALEAGHTVVGTIRDPDQIGPFEELAPGRAHARVLDVTDAPAIEPFVSGIESGIGPIDVLVNNAGYGVEGTFEETPLDVVRHQFEVNVFGPVALTRAVLPFMRARRAGHIVFVTSMGGLRTFPGLSAYHGSKYALEGFASIVGQEVSSLGIAVTAIEPGAFRTDWAGRSMHRVDSSLQDYREVFGQARENRISRNGSQPGDPALAGQALLAVVGADAPPTHLILGSDALQLVAQARADFDAETERWRATTLSTDVAGRAQRPGG